MKDLNQKTTETPADTSVCLQSPVSATSGKETHEITGSRHWHLVRKISYTFPSFIEELKASSIKENLKTTNGRMAIRQELRDFKALIASMEELV